MWFLKMKMSIKWPARYRSQRGERWEVFTYTLTVSDKMESLIEEETSNLISPPILSSYSRSK